MLKDFKRTELSTVNSRFKKDLKFHIHLHKAFFLDDWFLDSLHEYFLNQTTLNLRKEFDLIHHKIILDNCL